MIKPPGSIEQLNNFRDSIQSPDGLDRLRAMQYVQASSQGLSGMPQVTAPVPQMQPQVPMMNRAYGGEVGTGGLISIAEDGTQVFNNSQEGALNRAIHGGVLEGYNFTPSTGGTATATSTPVTTNSLDAPGTLASGTTGSTGFEIEDGMADQYGNTVGDFSGTKNYYDLNYAAKDAGQKTFMYGGKLMSVDPGFQRGMSTEGKNFISNKIPEDMITNAHLYSSYQSGSPHTYNVSATKRPDLSDPAFYSSEAPYVPTEDFSRDISGQYGSYYDANLAAKDAGSPTFMWGDKWAKTDPGLLPNYDYAREGPKPFISNAVPEKYANAGVYLPPGWANMSAKQMAKSQPDAPTGLNWDDQGRRYRTGAGRGASLRTYFSSGGQITAREGGGQVDPAQAAEGLASFGRYGDNILVHMNPEELDGLASLGKITYNPVTGLPEAFNLGKMLRKLAPIALAIAAPYAFGATTALGIGASTALGSFAGNLIAGAKPKDALKAGLFSGVTAGFGSYLGGASSGFGSAGSAAGQGAAGYGSAAMQGSSAGINSLGGATYGSTAGSTALKAGLGAPSSMGAKGFSQGIAGGGGSPFSGVASYGNIPKAAINTAARPQLQLAPQPVAQGTTVYGMPENPNMAQIGQAQAGEQVTQFNPSSVPEGTIANTINPKVVEPNQFNQTLTGKDLSDYSRLQGSPTAPYESPTANLRIQSRAQLEGTPTNPSLFQDSSMDNFKRIGQNIYDDYGNWKGAAKLVGMDLATPDWDVQYAEEAAAKNQQLTDAGYTVETDFDGQTVIRDSRGVVQPRNLTPQMLLDRALGKTPRTNLVDRYGYGPAQDKREGGLIGLKHGGEFSGMVPGDGHGMEDNVYMPIIEKEQGSQVGTLAVSPTEYVVDSFTMAALGNGNANAGAKVMDNVVKNVRKKAYGNTKQPNEISGLKALQPMTERA